MDKIKKETNEIRYQTDSGKVRTVEAEFDHGIVEISKPFNGELRISFKNGKSTTTTDLKFFMGRGIFSISYWRWRAFCWKAESKIKKEDQRQQDIIKKAEQESINRAMLQTFPDLLEKEIFGDD